MKEPPRYLLARGERLTRPVVIGRGSGPKAHPYEWDEQRERVGPMAARTADAIANLPPEVCPDNRSVALLTLHPTYFAKSYFPSELLRSSGLRPIGSRPVFVTPKKGSAGQSTAVFIAGKREAFGALAEAVPSLSNRNSDLLTIEDLCVPTVEERLRIVGALVDQTLEVVLHAPSDWDSVIEGFDAYVRLLGLNGDIKRRHYVRDLCFMPVRARADKIAELARFSFIRVARTMPRLREMRPAVDIVATQEVPEYAMPDVPAMDRGIRVAIFDGGLSPASPLKRWVRAKETSNLGSPDAASIQHGTDVTSAALFGSVDGSPLPAPYAEIDHYRVLDENSYDQNGEYYDVLDRIVEVLGTTHYDFVNLSLGPRLPIEDDEIHPWTAKLDEMLSSGKTLLLSAAGNDGERDRQAGLARIQPPSDGVNLLSVGAATSIEADWQRAPYSCIGPGRSPGVTKPDIVSFGGHGGRPYYVIGSAANGAARGTCGTSFAAPNAMRLSMGLRAHFGATINPLAIKALLVHHADQATHDPIEVGWGAVFDDVQRLVECPSGTTYVLYQGVLEPRQHMRFDVPMPEKSIEGYVLLRVTFCIATDIDPEDASNYTRSGLVPTFRPNKDRRTSYWHEKSGEMRTPLHPDSESFFKLSEIAREQQLREDALEWETVLRREKRFRGSRLKDPMFDVHFNPREGGADASNPKPIPYALVITIRAERMPDLYDRIASRYRTQLEALQPVIAIPIRTQIQPD